MAMIPCLFSDLLDHLDLSGPEAKPKSSSPNEAHAYTLPPTDFYIVSKRYDAGFLITIRITVMDDQISVHCGDEHLFTINSYLQMGPMRYVYLPQTRGIDGRYNVRELLDYLLGKERYQIKYIMHRYTRQSNFSFKQCLTAKVHLSKSGLFWNDPFGKDFDLSDPGLYCTTFEIHVEDQRLINTENVSWPGVNILRIDTNRWNRRLHGGNLVTKIPERWFPNLKVIECPVQHMHVHPRVSRYAVAITTGLLWDRFSGGTMVSSSFKDDTLTAWTIETVCEHSIHNIIRIRIDGWDNGSHFITTRDRLRETPKLVLLDFTMPDRGDYLINDTDQINYNKTIYDKETALYWPLLQITSPSLAKVICSLIRIGPYALCARNKTRSMYRFMTELSSCDGT